MTSVERVDDPTDLRLADYLDLRGGRPPANGPVIVEGFLAIEALAGSRYQVRSALVSERKLDRLPPLPGDPPIYVADDAVLQATVGFDLHRGAVASADRPAPLDVDEVVRAAGTVLVLERVNDLENLGVLFRNARAFAVDAVVLDPETADPLNRRTVRVSLGHVLHVRFARATAWPGALDTVRAAGLTVIALTPAGDPLPERLPPRAAYLVGAEGPGLTDAALAAADRRARIPMAAGVDSLNVATAAGIALAAHFQAAKKASE